MNEDIEVQTIELLDGPAKGIRLRTKYIPGKGYPGIVMVMSEDGKETLFYEMTPSGYIYRPDEQDRLRSSLITTTHAEQMEKTKLPATTNLNIVAWECKVCRRITNWPRSSSCRPVFCPFCGTSGNMSPGD